MNINAMFGVMQARAAQVSSSVCPVDCVSRKDTCVTVTMTAETTRMKPTVETVNIIPLRFGFTAPITERRLQPTLR